MRKIINNCPDILGNPKSKSLYSNVTTSQRARILNHFEAFPKISTIQARTKYGVLNISPRVIKLKKIGHIIKTLWIKKPDANDVLHRVGLYVDLGKQEVPHA
ncbi:Uncharacterised protein [Legionella steigerwaltii]|uniref:Winged helix-turn-helix domain-containing protein n=1 Tax=Legionella steigerwaltii TaxID=460 RepID=A0A378LC39_9GAMM|nr:helix-turn-helix domain-containing protein [Legionella steigerwaltii]KTD79520.1 hypothetical protein Lstg_0736 [Legionella steigerwaltii]STY24595.1 Uncharacterised protein [Legionella steigerwaltii]